VLLRRVRYVVRTQPITRLFDMHHTTLDIAKLRRKYKCLSIRQRIFARFPVPRLQFVWPFASSFPQVHFPSFGCTGDSDSSLLESEQYQHYVELHMHVTVELLTLLNGQKNNICPKIQEGDCLTGESWE
jgi:hypothetical protein